MLLFGLKIYMSLTLVWRHCHGHRHKSVISRRFKVWWRQAVTSFLCVRASSNRHFYPSRHWCIPLVSTGKQAWLSSNRKKQARFANKQKLVAPAALKKLPKIYVNIKVLKNMLNVLYNSMQTSCNIGKSKNTCRYLADFPMWQPILTVLT